MGDSYTRRAVLGVLGLCGALVGKITGRKAAASTLVEPLFVHRFSEVASDRAGFRKYEGTTKRVVVKGTLLAVSRPGSKPPADAIGEIMIGHTLFFRAKDFTITGAPQGTSILYIPTTMTIPAELLQL